MESCEATHYVYSTYTLCGSQNVVLYLKCVEFTYKNMIIV